MKFKKILIILLVVFITGCTNINDMSYDDIVQSVLNSKNTQNTYNKGYSYYLPNGVLLYDSGTNYAIINGNDINYYLFVDLVSYYNKSSIVDNIQNISEYYKKLDDKGYITIDFTQNNDYLIEIVYNYAKIEVRVNKKDIKNALINALNILKSIKYDDVVINQLLSDDNLGFTEEKFEMFKEVIKSDNN